MNFATKADRGAEIEETLVHASGLGMDDGDLRVLSVLTEWLGVHHPYVNVDRLVRVVSANESSRVRAYWAAIASWLAKDRRFARVRRTYRGRGIDLMPVGTEFQLQRRGEDERFAGSSLRAPRGVLRERAGDVLEPALLVQRHAGFRNRVIIGPTWRADVWTVLEKAPQLSVAEAARRASCSFATAWQAARDFRLVQSSTP
jgi:hypothetical protein